MSSDALDVFVFVEHNVATADCNFGYVRGTILTLVEIKIVYKMFERARCCSFDLTNRVVGVTYCLVSLHLMLA